MCLAGAAICLETLDGPVDGKIVLPPSLPAWTVSMDCLSFFLYVFFLSLDCRVRIRSVTHSLMGERVYCVTLVESLLSTLPYTYQLYTESILLRGDCLDFVHTD